MRASNWTECFPPFEMLLEWSSGQLQDEESWKNNWKTSISKTISRSLDESCNPKSCSSRGQVYGHLQFYSRYRTRNYLGAESSVSERAIHCNVNRGQGTLSGSNNQELSTAPKEAAATCSTSTGRFVQKIVSTEEQIETQCSSAVPQHESNCGDQTSP